MDLDTTDRALLDLLRDNARATTSALARRLGVSRSTVQDRLQRLERRRVVAGYTVKLGENYAERQISAHVMIRLDPKQGPAVGAALEKMPAVRTLQTVSGVYDLVVTLETATTADMDRVLDEIGQLQGVEKTTTSIVLNTKLSR